MEWVEIDGSYGEGGGQVLRTSLTLSALTGRAVRIDKIRAGRRKPGLEAQHLTGVLACARLCDAALEGARLGSTTLTFAPRRPPQAGEYRFDVAEQRKGGSAGSVTLVLHTLLLPLAWAEGESKLTVRGGTHVAWSPPYHHLERVYFPMLAKMGLSMRGKISRWGWYPQGGGEVTVWVHGASRPALKPLQLEERGALRRLWLLSAYSELPAHVGERQGRRAESLLRQARNRQRRPHRCRVRERLCRLQRPGRAGQAGRTGGRGGLCRLPGLVSERGGGGDAPGRPVDSPPGPGLRALGLYHLPPYPAPSHQRLGGAALSPGPDRGRGGRRTGRPGDGAARTAQRSRLSQKKPPPAMSSAPARRPPTSTPPISIQKRSGYRRSRVSE